MCTSVDAHSRCFQYEISSRNFDPILARISHLSDMKRGMIVEARLAGASMSGTTNCVVVSKTIVSKFMTFYTNLGNVPSEKHNSG
ncbi:hypothetical protein TNCV_3284691 [Trichonephila clavipes]|nr:hypothetical protein TNCV_3284691 [Trichonephila clavipes]